MRMIDRRSRKPSLLACIGGLLAAASIGLAAYAAHGVADPHAQSRLQTAALYAFGHGVALAALGRKADRLLETLSLSLLLVGTLLFSGSLLGGALWGWSTRFAPAGGIAMMAGWVLFAFNAMRR
ncbi:MAG: DUF423 domain-containing protein [Gammaproteobacteria bacterium]|uniref:DUF423 domain-containing protein n=1 Tax=Xanthomonas boreopolis TaxID=86183 RepID=UPI0032DD4DE8